MKRYLLIFIIWGLGAVGLVIWRGWEQLAALATWFLVLGIVFAILQVQQMRRSTNAQIAIQLFQELRSDKALQILRFIYGLEPKDIKNLSDDEKNKITFILERLGMLGALIANKIIDEKLAIEVYGGATALKCWYQLKDYIRGVENRQGLQWGIYVEDFAGRTLEHWKNYKPRWVLYYRNEGDEPIDLVEKLRADENLRPRRLKKESHVR